MKANTYFINLLKRRGNSLNNLKQFLIRDNGENYNRVVSFLNRDQILKNSIYDSFFPKIISNKYPHYLDSLPVLKILMWYCNIVIGHSKFICDFEEEKLNFERNFLAGKYDISLEILQDVEMRFGLSLWLLDCYSLLEVFGNLNHDFEKDMHPETLSWYKILRIKNRKAERQPQYKHRIDHMLANSNEQISSYYKYKLFSDMPFGNIEKTDENWRNILLVEGGHSLIDIYLVTTDCLQYYLHCPKKTQLSIFEGCIKLISKIDTPICQIMSSSFYNSKKECDMGDLANDYICLIKQKKFPQVVHFFSNNDYSYTCFNAYIYAAVSALHRDSDLDINGTSLSYEILRHIYNILRKSDIALIDESIANLRSISRVLRSFTIHKGICVFLGSQINIDINYFFAQQATTYDDRVLLSYEINNEIPELSPYAALCVVNKYDENNKEVLCKKASEIGVASNYYEAAFIKIQIYDFVKRMELSQAVSLFFNSYVKNPHFIYPVDIGKIREYLDNKIQNQSIFELVELCYVFIDQYYKDMRKSCFLNFIDDVSLDEPLDIIRIPHYNETAIFFFLCNICTIDMLNSLYMVFESSDDARDYRIKICEFLLSKNTLYSKELKREIEELAKNKAMRQRLLNVDRSRVSINTRAIQEDIYEDIEYQIDACNSQISDEISSQTKETYFIFNPQISSYLCMYETYAKAFCFSQSGLDTSLSTRVRHGAFINQIFRTFTENCLIYSDGKAKYFFDTLFESGKVKHSLKPFLHELHVNIQNKLQYFTQHTLKVFIDEPIDGAVFNYSAGYNDGTELKIEFVKRLLNGSVVNTNDAINLLHQLLIDKTNSYLNEIRSVYLPRLEESLLSLLNSFSGECGKHTTDSEVKKELQRQIAQCKTDLQSEFKTVKDWFYLSENEQWEDYEFTDLLEICIEITKKLFSGFDKVKISKTIHEDFIYTGKTFRINTDIILILLNNAFLHSGFEQKENNLHINCTVTSDSNYIYFAVENNLSDSIDISALNKKIDKINEDYKNEVYTTVNTRQEGGMGLYKIMIILYNMTKDKDSFYISQKEHKVRVEIKLGKDLICCEENTTS